MKDINEFSKAIKTIQNFKKLETNPDNILFIEDNLHSKLLDSMIENLNPGIKRELISVLNQLIPMIKKLRVVNYKDDYYIVEDGKEGYIFFDSITKIDHYLRLSPYDISIKIDNRLYHHDLMTKSMDVTKNKRLTLEGITMSYNDDGTEVHRKITEVSKEESKDKFEKIITYTRDEFDDSLIHVNRTMKSYSEGKEITDAFNIFIYHPDLDIILENYYKEDIAANINKGRTI